MQVVFKEGASLGFRRIVSSLLAASLCFPIFLGDLVSSAEAQAPICPAMQVVFLMDISGSMGNEGKALCESIDAIKTDLASQGIVADSFIYGLNRLSSSSFPCLTDTVTNLYGAEVPGEPGACGLNLDHVESWGPATSIIAERFPWAPGAVKVIVPISDEGPCDGNGCNASDTESITNAINISLINEVVVSPIAGNGSGTCPLSNMDNLSSATGGQTFLSTDPNFDLAAGLTNLLLTACANANNPPTANCEDNVTVAADAECQATASIDAGSSDIDGDAITVIQSPSGPFSLGTHNITLTVTDSENDSNSCSGTVTVVDATPPELNCNVTAALSSAQLPLTFTTTSHDNCVTVAPPRVTGFSCKRHDGNSNETDVTGDCDVVYEDDHITINSIGSADEVTWVIEGKDEVGNPITKECSSMTPDTPEDPDEDLTSETVQCVQRDSSESLFVLDGNSLAQRLIVRQFARYLHRAGVDRKEVRKVKRMGKESYERAWTATWKIPTRTISCDDSATCQEASLSELLYEASGYYSQLNTLVNEVGSLLKDAQGGNLRRKQKKFLKRSKSILFESENLLQNLPTTRTICGKSTTVVLDK